MNEPVSFSDIVLGVSDFVALANQTLEYAYPSITIRGELANFRVSKNRWVYFDLKDQSASVRFFGTVYQLSGPLEDGMLLRVRGAPRLHPQYGFSVTVQSMQPEGVGAIRRAAELLQAKLTAEGLFDVERKRPLPYPPATIGLIASTESAAYADFIKVLDARWRGVNIVCADVQVQGEAATVQIVSAVEYFNQQANPPEVLVLTRGGGSPEDLFAFNTEQVTRAVASSRVPTLVAIGHEVDVSLAELAADRRASTPSNAAELLVPDRKDIRRELTHISRGMYESVLASIRASVRSLRLHEVGLEQTLQGKLVYSRAQLTGAEQLLNALDPRAVLKRGYAILRKDHRLVRKISSLRRGDIVNVELVDGHINALVE